MIKKKVLLMFSGGLDSRICAKFLEELGFEVELFYVDLPFNSIKRDLSEIKKFAEEENYKLHLIDVKSGETFQEYLEFVRNPKYGRGVAINPCKDCKIFIFKLVGDFFDKLGEFEILASGEVLGQRPMSQVKSALIFDDEVSKMKGRILRPLSAKVLEETIYEKEGLIERDKLLDLVGRRREVQIKMAEKYGIEYPTASGGCLLCDKVFGNKMNKLFEIKKNREINYGLISLLKFGKMFHSKGLIFSGRNEEENERIKKINEKLGWNIYFNSEIPGPTLIYESSEDGKIVKKIWEAYSEKNVEKIAEFGGIIV